MIAISEKQKHQEDHTDNKPIAIDIANVLVAEGQTEPVVVRQ